LHTIARDSETHKTTFSCSGSLLGGVIGVFRGRRRIFGGGGGGGGVTDLILPGDVAGTKIIETQELDRADGGGILDGSKLNRRRDKLHPGLGLHDSSADRVQALRELSIRGHVERACTRNKNKK